MFTKKVNEINDEMLIKCMRDFLEVPVKYHPEYLRILLKDYERRIMERIEHQGDKNILNAFIYQINEAGK